MSAPSATGGGQPLVARLVRLIRDRADAADRGEQGSIEPLSEAVRALGQVLDAVALLQEAEGDAPTPTPGPAPLEAEALAFARLDEATRPDPPARAPSPRVRGARGEREAPPSASETPQGDLEYAPFRDQVTGLHSREGFDAVASGELKRCRRHGRLFSLLLLELPELQPSALRGAANAISMSTRESDLAGRHGDRGMAIALPETGPTEARGVAERIMGHLERLGAWGEQGRIGLVTHPAHGETLLHLLDEARSQLDSPPHRVLPRVDPGGWAG